MSTLPRTSVTISFQARLEAVVCQPTGRDHEEELGGPRSAPGALDPVAGVLELRQGLLRDAGRVDIAHD